jgi:hypothetical protein
MSVSFLTDTKKRKLQKIFSVFIVFVLLFVNFYSLNTNTAHAADAWYDISWAHRTKITIDRTKVPNTNQTNFPVLISLSGLSNINANGTDIRFTSDDGTTLLAREVESYSSGSLVAWVKVPVLSTSVDTVIYMYYGNSGATEPVASSTYGSQKVWDDGGSNNYKAVWHLPNGTTLTANDSTSNLNNGTLSSTPPTATAGKADGAANFNGSSNYISRASQTTWDWATSDYTVEMWINNTSDKQSGVQGPLQIGKMIHNSGTQYWSFGTKANGNVEWYYWNGAIQRVTGTSVVPLNTWNHLTMTVSGTTIKLFLNGNLEVTGTKTGTIPTDSSTPLILGANNSTYYNGLFDETRISNTARSADWIKTEYNNQSSPSTFYSFINEEPPPPPDAPTAITAIPGNVQVSLAWEAPGFDGGSPITDYLIEYKPHGSSNWTQFGHVASTATTATIAGVGLLNGLSYDFKVSAINAWGVSIASNIAEATPATLPSTVGKAVATRGNTSASVAFTPFSDFVTGFTWYDNNWTYRQKITIDHTKVPNTNQTNFPVLVSLTGLSNINANGTDIRFASDDGSTLLAREIESYSNGALVAWVKVPVLSTSVDTVIYMYYGNSGATEPVASSIYGSQKVWDDGGSNKYSAVWHLNNPLIPTDSTSNLKNATNSGSAQTAGKIGYGGDFSGNDYISQPVLLGPSGTVSFWLNSATLAGSASSMYFGSSDDGSVNQIFGMQNWTNGSTYWGWLVNGSDKRVAVSQAFPSGFFLATLSWDTATGVTTLLWNGDQVGQTTGLSSVYTMAWTPYIMAYHNSVNFLFPATGSIDEVRISSIARSADWAKTEYNNQNSPSTFYSVATQEAVDDQYSGSPITIYTVTSSPGGITATGTTTPIIVSGLTNGTPYTFTIVATNAIGDGPASVASDPVTPATTPGEPTAVTPTAGNGQVSLLWSAPASNGGSEITDYVIEYKLTSAEDIPASWQISADPETPTIVATAVTGLINGTSYDFRISAVNTAGQGSPNSPVVNSTPKTVPDAPVITSVVGGNRQVTVNFTAPVSDGGSSITSYTITSNPDSVVFSSSTSPIIVTGLTNGTPYTFTMTATNVIGQGPASDASSSVTPAGVPGIPTGLTAVPGNTLVDLSWIAPANNGAEIINYVIEYKLRTVETWTQVGHAISALTTINVPDLINGSLYDLRVSAVNSAGTGSSTDPVVSSTPRTVPGQPTITSVTRGDGRVIVNFTAPVSDGGSAITNYTVTSDPQGITQTGTTSPIIISGLTNGTPYTFTVKATNVAGDGLVSTSSNSVIPAGVPGKATEVTAVAGNTQATITFTEPLSNGGSEITGYTVYSNSGGIDSNAGSADLSHTVTGLTNGQTYTFTVVAINDVGNSLASDPSSAITLPTTPTAPLNVATEVKSSSIKLTWSDPASNGGSPVTDYIIEYQLTTGGSWVPFDDGVGVDKFTTVTGLSNGTSYDFRVVAKNIIGTSTVSDFVSATPGEPAQVRIMGFPDLTNTSIGTDVKITNEGLIEYEYQYTWCITDAIDNLCGGGDDVFSASNAKLIEQGHDFDFTATSTVSSPGNLYFHVNVLYGSEMSSAHSSFTAVATFPDPPTGVSAVAGNAEATVSFTIPASNGGSVITNYTVTSSPGGLIGGGLTTPIIVSGLTNGTPYTFTMSATNIIGTGLSSSPPSNSVTPMTVPDIISGLTAGAGNTQVGLSWNAPMSDGGSPITDYVIEYKLSSDSTWNIFADPISTVTTAIIIGLTNNLSYDFRVKAVNVVGQGPIYSASATSVAPPSTQTNSVVNGGSSGSRRRTPLPETKTLNISTINPNTEIVLPANSNTLPPTKVSETISTKTSNTNPKTNEVTATPTETSKISQPINQEKKSDNNLGQNKTFTIPWTWINISLLIMSLAGLIIFIIRYLII